MQNKKNRIPNLNQDRIDDTPINANISYKKSDQEIKSYIKNKEPVHPLTLRLPKSLYLNLRKTAFNENKTITNLIIDCINKKY